MSKQDWTSCLSSPLYGQEHILETVGYDEARLKHIYEQLDEVEEHYPGGVKEYISRSIHLLEQAEEGINTYAGYVPTKPTCVDLSNNPEMLLSYEKRGLANLNRVAFVLVAGGLGERLGYSNIKLSLPITSILDITYLQYYCALIQSYQLYILSTYHYTHLIPLAIMTSDSTHQETQRLLEKSNYYGLKSEQVHLLKQRKVPAVINSRGHFSLIQDAGQYKLEMKPHGHGDVHSLLYKSKLLEAWKRQNIEWVIFFQDTNPLVSHCICPLLGVSDYNRYDMNSVVVSRKPGEAVGVICALQAKDPLKHDVTVNIEYNILEPLLKDNGLAGDIADPQTQNSPFPGNTNIICINLETYSIVLHETRGSLKEFVNPKYTDSTRKTFKTSSRLECMMQDLPKIMTQYHRIGTTHMDRWLCFSSVKNNTRDAASKLQNNHPPECLFSGEADFYYANARLLEMAAQLNPAVQKLSIAKPVPTTFLNIEWPLGPKVVLMPRFGTTLTELCERIQGDRLILYPDSTLILDGNIVLHGLSVDGALSITVSSQNKLDITNLTVQNKGVSLTTLNNNQTYSEAARIRGYVAEYKEICDLQCT